MPETRGPLAEFRGHKAAAIRYCNEVTLYLHDVGLTAARRRIDSAEILGLPWTLLARNQANIDLSATQDVLAAASLAAGTELRAVIQNRKAHPIAAGYVTMPLSVFVPVLTRLHPELAPSREPPAPGSSGTGAGAR